MLHRSGVYAVTVFIWKKKEAAGIMPDKVNGMYQGTFQNRRYLHGDY